MIEDRFSVSYGSDTGVSMHVRGHVCPTAMTGDEAIDLGSRGPMSNRADFDDLALELRRELALSHAAMCRIATELHNAFVAGQEEADRTHDEEGPEGR